MATTIERQTPQKPKAKRNSICFQPPPDIEEALTNALDDTKVQQTFLVSACIRVALAKKLGKKHAEKVEEARRWIAKFIE